MGEDSANDGATTAGTRKRKRSPSFPFISLETAVERAEKFHMIEHEGSVAPEVAVGHWGYSPRSSGGKQTVAALKAYGLMETKAGRVGLTGLGLDIVVKGSPKRAIALKEAALNPSTFREMWDERGTRLGSPEGLRYELVRNRGFTQTAADSFIQNYQDTVRYAGIAAPDEASPEDQDSEDSHHGASVSPHTFMGATGAEERLPPSGEAGILWLRVPFKGSTLEVQIRAAGQELRREHIERVRAYLELAADDLEGPSEPE